MKDRDKQIDEDIIRLDEQAELLVEQVQGIKESIEHLCAAILMLNERVSGAITLVERAEDRIGYFEQKEAERLIGESDGNESK